MTGTGVPRPEGGACLNKKSLVSTRIYLKPVEQNLYSGTVPIKKTRGWRMWVPRTCRQKRQVSPPRMPWTRT